MKKILITICLSLTLLLPATQYADVEGEIVFAHPVEPRELWTARLNGDLNTRQIYVHENDKDFRIIGIATQKDGNYIAFLARSGDEAAGINKYNIYVLDKTRRGQAALNITQDRFGIISEAGFDISINGDVVLASSATTTLTKGIYLIPHEEFQQPKLVPQLLVENAIAPKWFPDAQRIVYVQGNLTSTLTVDNGNIEVLDGWGHLPAISPDGKYLARIHSFFGAALEIEIYSLNQQKMIAKMLLDRGDIFMNMKWTPDGDQIAYTTLFSGRKHYIATFNENNMTLGRLTEFLDEDILGHHVTLYDWTFSGAYPVEPTNRLATLWGKMKR